MKTKLLICFSILTTFLTVLPANQNGAQNSLIGIIKTPPSNGFGCYFVLPADINKNSGERRYLFVSRDYTDGLMNIGGSDLHLTADNSYQLKYLNGKKRFVWIYVGGGAKVIFNLTLTGTTNDGENTHYDAVIKADKDGQTQSIRAKGFCGG